MEFNQDYGIVEEDKKPEEKLKMIKCTRCTFENLPTGSLCSNCGLPLNDETAMRIEKIQEETAGLIDKDMLSELVKRYVLQELAKERKVETGLILR